MKDRYVYPAYFCYDLPGQVGVVFPDLPGCVSQGDSDEEALRMGREGLSLHLWGMEKDGDDIPEPTPAKGLRPESDQVIVLIDVFMPPFREHMNEKAVTKNVTLPRWLEMEAKAAGLNYSRVLQDGLMARLGIEREINHKPGKKKKTHVTA
jgi:predicted RNase H-like HicB family nuclease/post-segregation antitoxin (ccd killing protein)